MSLAIMPELKKEKLLLTTRAVNRGFQILDRAAQRRTIILGIANPGCSKTYLCKMWRRKNKAMRHVYIEADVLAAPGPVLGALVEAMQITPRTRSLVSLRNAMVERLTADPVLMIIDQADMLQVRTLEVLRTVWDRVSDNLDTDGDSAFGLAIFGTPELRARIKRPELERLHRRIDEIIELPTLNEPELRQALQAKWRLSLDDDANAELLRISRGSFGWLDRIVPKAVELAGKAGSQVTAKIVRSVERYLIGVEE